MAKNRSLLALILLGAALSLVLLAGLAFASTPAPSLAAYDVTLTPNWVSPNDPASANLQAVWLYPSSPTTPYRSPDSYHQQTRYLLLDPRATDADGRTGNDDWWFIIQRYWPASYPAANHGSWGREANFHNVAGDAGPDGGVGWGFGSGVSSLALDWLPGANSPQIDIEPNSPNNNNPLPVPSRNAWHTYVIHFTAGRTDGSTLHPGAITVWADGNDKPAISLSNINTVQRAKGPDGNWYVQRWMQLWEGDYTSALPVTSTIRLALTRIGTSLTAATADRPTVDSNSLAGQYYNGNGTNLGGPSVTTAAALSSPDAQIPATLDGTTPPTTTTAPPPAGSVLWTGDSLAKWASVQRAASNRITLGTSPVADGKQWYRYEVRHRDYLDSKRQSEGAQALASAADTHGAEGNTDWWAWSTYFSPTYNPQVTSSPLWNVYTQFQPTTTGSPAMLAFEVDSAHKHLVLAVSNGDQLHPTQTQFVLDGAFKPGIRYDHVLNVGWSSDPAKGFVQVNMNGKVVLPLTHIATLFTNQRPARLAHGLYRQTHNETDVVSQTPPRRSSSLDAVNAGF